MRHFTVSILAMTAALLAGCSSGNSTDDGSAVADAPEQQQREMVEAAVRRAYEADGAEVVEIHMERSADGSAFAGPATVRDIETGHEIRVDCRFSRNLAGEPSLECNRAAASEEDGVG